MRQEGGQAGETGEGDRQVRQEGGQAGETGGGTGG